MTKKDCCEKKEIGERTLNRYKRTLKGTFPSSRHFFSYKVCVTQESLSLSLSLLLVVHLASQPEEQEAKKTREDVDDEENNRLFLQTQVSYKKQWKRESSLYSPFRIK